MNAKGQQQLWKGVDLSPQDKLCVLWMEGQKMSQMLDPEMQALISLLDVGFCLI